MRVDVSGNVLKFPPACACCGGTADADLELAAERRTGKKVVRTETRVWHVPYCSSCLAHVEKWSEEWGCLTALLVVVTFGLWLIVQTPIDRRRQDEARKMCSPTCACPQRAAAFLGWEGSVKSFEFPDEYAKSFAVANAKALVNVSGPLRQLLADTKASAALSGRAVSRRGD